MVGAAVVGYSRFRSSRLSLVFRTNLDHTRCDVIHVKVCTWTRCLSHTRTPNFFQMLATYRRRSSSTSPSALALCKYCRTQCEQTFRCDAERTILRRRYFFSKTRYGITINAIMQFLFGGIYTENIRKIWKTIRKILLLWYIGFCGV